ncbi:MAG: hypothetical protein FJ221_04515 [Lentisphaerae bacterium]|nr:hypothetical protein [Lentisphaerota bacterium]
MNLGRFSMGIGDRFARQGRAQLSAFVEARHAGIDVTPVWNKSHREHSIVGSVPADVRREADAAVQALGWTGGYRVDADHIGLGTVDAFLAASDFFTLDVAHFIGRPAPEDDIRAFCSRHAALAREIALPGLDRPIVVTAAAIEAAARKFLLAVKEAGRTHRHIETARGADTFITEVSMDETDLPQTPAELLLILAAIADERIPAQTIAPKFTGRFNKGVDYEGDPEIFAREFEADVAVAAFAAREFGLPAGLKLSVHSGSDKFSLYPHLRAVLHRTGAGLHLKTAGTTWLEELIGLAAAGGEGLAVARDVYAGALARYDEMVTPYAAVIHVRRDELPPVADVMRMSAFDFTSALRHDPRNPRFNSQFRQFLHVSYKVAAEMGRRFPDALDACEATVAGNVRTNILDRHLRPVFG